MKNKLFLLFLALCYTTILYADRVKIGELYYEINISKKYAEVTYESSSPYNKNWKATSIIIPSTIKYQSNYITVVGVGAHAFENCKSLTSVVIPSTVKYIRESAFKGCSGLTSITIPDYVTVIGDKAFFGCSGLSTITIPKNVENVGNSVFSECKNLVSISVDSSNKKYCSVKGVLFTKDKKTLIRYPLKREGAYMIPKSVTTIGQRAFAGCEDLTSITIPKNVTRIEEYAFFRCTSLTSVAIPESVKHIGDGAFNACSNVSKPIYTSHIFAHLPKSYSGQYVIPNGITEIAGHAFFNCESLTSVTIPESVMFIEECAFSYCKNLTSITIPESVTYIGSFAFLECNNLTSVRIPEYITDIGGGIFHGCSKLSKPIYNSYVFVYLPKSYSGEYVIPNGITIIAGSAFYNCTNLTSVMIPESVTYIGNHAFDNCQNLTSVTIPKNVEYLWDCTFQGCRKLASIVLPDNLKIIGDWTFSGCESLTSITIPNKVTSIGLYAFNDCKSLSLIVIPKSVTMFYYGAFPEGNAVVYTTSTSILPFPEKNIKHISQEQLKLYNRPFSLFAKDYVVKYINEWQKKGEFEKTSDWQIRVNDKTRQNKIVELLSKAEKDYINFWKPGKQLNLQLGKYDADNEVFALNDPQFGAIYLPVPFEEAQDFKKNWTSKKLSHQLQIKDDQFKLASFTAKMSNGKSYTYRNTDAVNYNLAEVEYNFDPIELDFSSSTPQQGLRNIQKTTIKVGKSFVDTEIPVTDASNPNTYVIILANEDYKNVAPVLYAKNDGLIFQKYCQKTLGIPVSNIHYVENASFNDMRIQLAWLNDVCNAFEGNVSVIVYYAGHGIPDESSKSAYLLPVDGDSRYVQSAYKLDDMYQKLGSMNAKSVTIFMDACFSGSKREEGMLASARGVAIKAKSGMPQGKMVVFSAATGDETAYPNNDEQHGMFTYYLLKKLQETKGDVTLQDLGNYITTNVRQQSIVKNGKSQTPTVIPSADATDWQNWKLK